MTTPDERTRAVRGTREFLAMLYGSEEAVMWDLVRTVARQLLRHYPLDIDLGVSSTALPDVWAPPAHMEKQSRMVR